MDRIYSHEQYLENQNYRRRVERAQAAYVAAGGIGHMPGNPVDWRALYECTLLTPEQLIRAKARKIELLKEALGDTIDRSIILSRELSALKQSRFVDVLHKENRS